MKKGESTQQRGKQKSPVSIWAALSASTPTARWPVRLVRRLDLRRSACPSGTAHERERERKEEQTSKEKRQRRDGKENEREREREVCSLTRAESEAQAAPAAVVGSGDRQDKRTREKETPERRKSEGSEKRRDA